MSSLKWAAALLLLLLLIGCSEQSATRVAYLWVDEADRWQLFVTADGDEPQQLTFADGSIFDYAVSPDGKTIAYSVAAEAGGRSLWQVEVDSGADELLLDCGPLLCHNPQWHPNGMRLLYERRQPDGDDPRLFWLDVIGGETLAVYDDESVLGYNGRLSFDGRYLSFVNIEQHAGDGRLQFVDHDDHDHGEGRSQPTVIFDLESGERLVVPNLMNSSGVWHPSAPEMLLPDIQFFGEQIGSHLLHVDMTTDVVTDLSVGQTVEDAAPSWSPDGSLIVFHRKLAGTPMGRQLWLMNADGSEPRALSSNSDWHHGAAQFSPDGRTLLFQRFDISQPNATPSIWIHDLASGEERQLAAPGSRPQWLP